MEKLLAIESISWNPHLETSGEILLNHKNKKKVAFVFIGNNLPWIDGEFRPWWGLFLGDFRNRVRSLTKILHGHGVDILRSASINRKCVKRVKLWARSFNGDLTDLKNYSYKGQTLGLGVASSLISKYRSPNLNTSDFHEEICNSLLTSALVYERALTIICQHKPDAVLTFNGRFASSYPIVKAAQAAEVKVLLHDRGCDYHKYEIYDTSIHSVQAFKKRVIEHWDRGTNAAESHRIGDEFFTKRRAGGSITMGWSPIRDLQTFGETMPRGSKLRIVYFHSSDDELASVENDAIQYFSSEGQLSAVKKLIAVCEKISNIELVVRMHPNSAGCDPVEISKWDRLKESGVVIISPESKIDSYALADTADLVCSFGSTMGVEASYWGKPSIILGDCPYYGLGCCFEPKNEAELEDLILNIPGNWDIEGCIKYGYYISTFGQEFHFYRPSGFFEGAFCNKMLTQNNILGNMVKRLFSR